jgi:signal transduction histidine kinase
MDDTGRLSVRSARDGDRVLVEIGDSGPGIPRPPPPTSWSPSTPPSRSARAPAWARHLRIVQRHHGDLRSTSTPGDTRFQVLLPLTQNG